MGGKSWFPMRIEASDGKNPYDDREKGEFSLKSLFQLPIDLTCRQFAARTARLHYLPISSASLYEAP